MSTTEERIAELLRLHAEQRGQRRPSARALSIDAGLSPNYLGTLLTRLRTDAEAGLDYEPARRLSQAVRGVRSAAWIVTGTDDAPAPAEQLAPFDEAARFARANGAPEWAIERVRTRAARLVRDRTADDYWQMIRAAIAEGEDEAGIADVGHAPAPGDIAAPRRGRK